MGRYKQELDIAIKAAQEAGNLLLEEFNRPGGPQGESGHCPADDEAERIIRDIFDSSFPTYGQLGEELYHRNRLPSDKDHHVWVIDPNDGTRSYQSGWRGSAVSIALLRRGRPVLGVVFAYSARAGHGDLFTWAEGDPLTRNGIAVGPIDGLRPDAPNTVLVSQSGDKKSIINAEVCFPYRFRTVPSIAYRLALVAAGEGIAGFSLSEPVSWDIAGGHALLIGAGLELLDTSGRPVSYEADGECNQGNCLGGEAGPVGMLAKRSPGLILSAPKETSGPYPLVMPTAETIVKDPNRLNRAQGCLLGQIAGDNLGSLVEFSTAAAIAGQYREGPNLLEDGGRWDLLAGQPTDDSELALILARSIEAAGKYDDEEAVRAYVYWLDSKTFDIGGTTLHALSAAADAMRNGESALVAAVRAASGNKGSQANGALMRVSPLGIYGYRLSDDELAGMARRDARITHASDVCGDANAIFCIALAAAIRGEKKADIYKRVLEWGGRTGVDSLIAGCLANGEKSPPDDYSTHMGWVVIALQNAFYQLLNSSGVEEGVVNTVRAGGDTDTNAAIAGALLGAYYGADSFPHQWVDRILTCRPIEGLANCKKPRPKSFWPVDCLHISERLLWLGS